MTPCEVCHGTGSKELATGEEIFCPVCCGLGTMEAASMLKALVAVTRADQLARSQGQPGLGSGLRAILAGCLAELPHSSVVFAETHTMEAVR